MLNIFPSLLDFYLVVPLILRVVVGVLFFRFGVHKVSKKHSLKCTGYFQALGVKRANTLTPVVGVIEIIFSISLILGLYTQLGAIVLGSISLITYLLMKSKKVTLSHTQDFYFLLFVINLSLLITGAGAYAIDLPL